MIHGGDGRDKLYGQYGHDNLYGGGDIDMLYGGSEGDGLYGGYGLDLLEGGTGADRFLVHESPALSLDLVADEETRDAIFYFRDGVTDYKFMGSNIGWVEVVGASWTEEDIEMVDGALNSLHHITGNTKLLETADGESNAVYRYGKVYNAKQLRRQLYSR